MCDGEGGKEEGRDGGGGGGLRRERGAGVGVGVATFRRTVNNSGFRLVLYKLPRSPN